MTDKQREYQRQRYAAAKVAYDEWINNYPLTLESLDSEEWKDIAGYEGGYQVSTFGRVKSFKYKTPRILTPALTGKGYLMIILRKDNKSKATAIHKLVAKAFIPNPEGKREVNHRDGHKLNCHVSNLEWVTSSENKRHAYDTGLIPQGGDRSDSKLTNEQVEWCRQNYIPYHPKRSAKALAEKLGVQPYLVHFAIQGRTYKVAGGNRRNDDSKMLPPETREQIKKIVNEK